MNKYHRFLAPSLSLLLVGTMFGCVNSANQGDDLFAAKTNATITFNAIEGIGKWGSTGTSIRTLTLLKGYTWGYLKANLKDDLKTDIISGGDIEFVEETRTFTERKWAFSDGSDIPDDYIINDDVIFNADYNPIYIGATFVADEAADIGDAHHLFNDGTQKIEVSKEPGFIKKGTKWKEIKGNYVPICVDGYENEPFMYYQNASGEKVSDEYTLKDGDVLKAVYQINHPLDFMTDSWVTISEAANLGLLGENNMSTLNHNQGGYKEEYLADSYEYHGHTYNKEANTFVGLRHEVQIGSKTYDAVVVGEGVDKVSNTANATLTFQIEQVVNTSKSYDTIEHNLNRYAESALREYLNENFIYTLSPDLQNAIVPVNKKTNWGGREESQGDIRESMEYIFPFSLAELGITYTKGPDDEEIPVEAEGFGDDNKASYKYYEGATDAERVRKTLKNIAMPYWVRSPDCDVTGFSWSIDEEGKVVERSSDILNALSVVCGFCVGAKR